MAAVVLARFHTLNGLTAGTTLLVLMAALKLLETRSARDQLVLDRPAAFPAPRRLPRPPGAAARAAVCAAGLAVLRRHRRDRQPRIRRRAPHALWLRGLMLALPLALPLFLFFPRLAGSFWADPARHRRSPGSPTR